MSRKQGCGLHHIQKPVETLYPNHQREEILAEKFLRCRHVDCYSIVLPWSGPLLQLQLYLFSTKTIKIYLISLKHITKTYTTLTENLQLKVKSARYLPGLFQLSFQKSEIYIKMLQIIHLFCKSLCLEKVLQILNKMS